MKRFVVGILAHVDSGKTTLSEAMLYRTGTIRSLGRVDHGDSFLDSHTLERNRGITIFSKQAVLTMEDLELTLLDTPGHVDFSAEMERTLQVLDYAILVISGTDGVQSHTETLWRLLQRYQIPTFLFINKMDLAGADADAVLHALQDRLDARCLSFSGPTETPEFYEQAALCEESLMQEYLETDQISTDALRRAIAKRALFPCYFGAALRLKGVDALLSGLQKLTVSPKKDAAFGAKVFKIAADPQGNRLTYCKITSGSLHVRTMLSGFTPEQEIWQEKVSQIRRYSGEKFQALEAAQQGMVCALTGLMQTYPGQGLGEEPDSETPILEPVLTYRVILEPEQDATIVLRQFRELEQEDPQLHVMWNAQLQEIHIQLMGDVQLEILKSLMQERYQTAIEFAQGSIAYKETIAEPVEGIGHYEPLRHYAEVHIWMEPGKPGSGLVVASNCSESELDRNWQRLILTHLKEKTHVGVLTGSPLTDVKLTLVAGRAHQKHTEGGDFRQATYRAVRQGLMQAKSVLLEPWYQFRLELPSDCVGRAIADIQRMDGTFSGPETMGELAVLTGKAPVSEMQGYQSQVNNYTHGMGRLSCMLSGYAPCHNAEAVIAAIGYDCVRDLEHPADSIFCAHGAGFAVKWDQVPQHAHVSYEPPAPQAEPELPAVSQQQVRRYCSRLAEDQELLKIFERTYGPIRRDLRYAMEKPPEAQTATTKQLAVPAVPEGPEYLLVDGYNVIFAWENLKALAQESLDLARSQLIHLLCNYQGFRQCAVILVFDAYKVKGNPGSVEQVHNIHVVYTKEAETADSYIEKATHDLGKRHRVRVVTSDYQEQIIILGNGALRISALEFQEEYKRVEQAIQAYLQES